MTTSEDVGLLAERLQTVRYMHVVDLTLLLFDYVLTFGSEVSLIWPSRWTISKTLYFLARYSPLFDVPILLYYSMVSNLSPEQCEQLQSASSWGTVFGFAVAEAILILRTYALSGQRRGVIVFFTSSWVVGISVSIVLLAMFENTVVYGPPPSPSIPGCYMLQGNVIFAGIDFVIVLVNDTIIMAYTLWIGMKNYRHTRNPLIITLYTDGIIYYFFLCAISALNVATMLQAPSVTAQLFNTFLRVIHSILSTRIVLHVRDVERRESERRTRSANQANNNISFAFDSETES